MSRYLTIYQDIYKDILFVYLAPTEHFSWIKLNQLGLSDDKPLTLTGLISIGKKTGILRREYGEDGQLKPL